MSRNSCARSWYSRALLTYVMLCPALCAMPLAAQSAEQPVGRPGARALSQYAAQVWNDTHGLPQNSVQAITQTTDGYLWLGTQTGIARFDGVRFTVFDRDDTPALSRPYVWTLAAAADGGLWIGTEEAGIIYKRGDTYRTITTADGLPTNYILQLREDRNGTLWIGMYGEGAARLRNGRIDTIAVTGQSAVGRSVSGIVEDSNGDIWISTYAELHRMVGDSAVPLGRAAGI